MKEGVLISLLTLIGCSKTEFIQKNINSIEEHCKEISECIDRPYKIEINFNSKYNPIVCIIKYSETTEARFYPPGNINIEEAPPAWGYLGAAVKACEMGKGINDFSKQNQDVRYRYKKCIDLEPNDDSHRVACRDQYMKKV